MYKLLLKTYYFPIAILQRIFWVSLLDYGNEEIYENGHKNEGELNTHLNNIMWRVDRGLELCYIIIMDESQETPGILTRLYYRLFKGARYKRWEDLIND